MTAAHLRGPPLPPLLHPTIGGALQVASTSSTGLTFLDAREQARELPFRELWQRARRAAWALADRGIERGDRVAMVLPTGESFMDAFFGALLAGAVPVPLYPPVRLGRMDEYVRSTARMLELTQARACLTDRRVRLLLGGAIERARPDLGCPLVAELTSESS